MNPTITKFGFPATLVRQFEHWLLLARPSQVTLGSLVLAAKSDATAYSDLSPDAFNEQAAVIADIERALAAFTSFERINYLMLMMVDRNVHFHVIPRYSQPRRWRGLEFADAGWPGPPRLDTAVALEGAVLTDLVADLVLAFE